MVAGSDDILADCDFDREGLRTKVLQYKPSHLAFTSKRAAEEYLQRPVTYGPLQEAIDITTIFVLPSPSGAARRYWDIELWRELARTLRAVPIGSSSMLG